MPNVTEYIYAGASSYGTEPRLFPHTVAIKIMIIVTRKRGIRIRIGRMEQYFLVGGNSYRRRKKTRRSKMEYVMEE